MYQTIQTMLIGLCICFALMALLKAEGFNLLIILSAISFIVFRLITNTGITLLHEVIIDYETKKITCTFKKNKKELEKVEFNFDEIVVSTFRSKNQGIFLQIEENEKSISFLEGKSGLETNEFHKLKSELNQIEHQNSAWWRNMKEVFPNIP